MLCRIFSAVPVLLLVVLSGANVGCNKESKSSPDAQVQALQLKEELDRSRRRLATAERALAAKQDEGVLAKEETANTAKNMADKDEVIKQKDAQIAALEKQMADLKKGEAFTYAETSKLMQQGLKNTALDHYRKFVTTYPTSSLVSDANRAIAELTVTIPQDAKAHAAVVDPHAAEREFQKHFAEGFASMEDIVSMLRKKSMQDVMKLLGPPNRTYRDNTEFGYVDKVIDPTSGDRATLVIGFDQGQVATLRVGYGGRAIRP